MPKAKDRRPPLSPEKVATRLNRAQSELGLVAIRRWIANADRIDGFAVAQSDGWILLARLSDRVVLDGWTALRRADIQSVTRYPVEDNFEIKALEARGQWPPEPPDQLRLGTTEDVLRMAAASGPMVSVFREFERPRVCWIGALRRIKRDTLMLLEVNVAGGWARKPRLFDLDDVTRVDFGGGYEEALHLVAGPAPAR